MDSPDYRQLPVILTPDERLARGTQAAQLVEEIEAVEAEKKEITTELGRRLKRLRREVSTLSQAVRTGKEYQPVEVVQKANPERMTVETMRLDTYEVIDSRPMTVAERQGGLFDGVIAEEGARQ